MKSLLLRWCLPHYSGNFRPGHGAWRRRMSWFCSSNWGDRTSLRAWGMLEKVRHVLTGSEGPQRSTRKLTLLCWVEGVNSLPYFFLPLAIEGHCGFPLLCCGESSLSPPVYVVIAIVFSIYLFGPSCLGLFIGWWFADRVVWVENTLLGSALKWCHIPPRPAQLWFLSSKWWVFWKLWRNRHSGKRNFIYWRIEC